MGARRARFAATAALGLLGALAAGAGVAWWQRCALAEWLALRELAARGAPAQLRVVRLDARGAELADLALGAREAPDLALEHAALAWSWGGLRAGRLDRIALRGLRLRARVGERGLELGALEALLTADGAAPAEPLALPFLEATLADARAEIDSPQGTLRLRGDGHAAPEGDVVRATLALHGESREGALDFGGGASVDLASQEIGAAGALAGVTPWGRVEGHLRAFGTLAALRVEFSGSALPDARALGVSAAQAVRVEGSAAREGGALAGSARFDAAGVAISDLGDVARVSGEASFRDEGAGLALDARFEATGVRAAGLGAAAGAAGTASLRGDAVEARVALREVALSDLGRAPAAALRLGYDLARGATSAHLEVPRALAAGLARVDGLVADLGLAHGALAGDVRAAKVTELSSPALIAPLRVDAKLSGSLERIAFSGTARTPGDGLAFDLSGALVPARETVDLRVALAETDLAPGARQPSRVFPWLAGTIERARGRIGLQALATFAGGELAASAVIALNGVDLTTAHGTLRGLMGVFSVTDVDPLATPPGQTIWMSSAEVGLPLGNGSVKFQLKPEGVLDVERGEWAFAGGKIAFSGAIPLDATERRLELGVAGVSVEQLLAALDFEGLAGTGVLAGTTPLLMSAERQLVTNGELRATQTGVIRFRSGEGGAALARKQPALAPVLGALEDLHYDELALTLNGDIDDRVDVKLHIRGRNPNFQKGRPVVLNVNVDLPLGSLLRAAAVATGVPEEIEEQVQKAMGKEKP